MLKMNKKKNEKLVKYLSDNSITIDVTSHQRTAAMSKREYTIYTIIINGNKTFTFSPRSWMFEIYPEPPVLLFIKSSIIDLVNQYEANKEDTNFRHPLLEVFSPSVIYDLIGIIK